MLEKVQPPMSDQNSTTAAEDPSVIHTLRACDDWPFPAAPRFRSAWDAFRAKGDFDALPPEQRAAVRIGFVNGWRARENER